MATDNEKIVYEVEVKTGNTGASIKGVRAELRALTQEMATLEPGSQAFNTAAKRAGELRDRMQDAQAAIKAFNPEAKFQAFAGLLGGVANGFSAVQGAMALFGSENKNVQEAILKTQGAMAIATGLNGLMGMKDSVKILGGVIQSTIPILKGFSAAMLGAITGGITIALTLIIAYWDDLKFAITGTVDATIMGTEEIAAAQKKGSAAYKAASDERFALQMRELNLMDEGVAKEKAIAKLQYDKARQDAAVGKASMEEKLLIEKEYRKKLSDIDKAEAKRLADIKKKNQDDERKRKQEQDEWENQNIEEGNARIRSEQEAQDKWEEDNIREGNARILKENEDLAKAEKDAKLATFDAIGNGLNSLGQLAGANAEQGKALGVASSIIDTWTGATKAFAQGGMLGWVGAAAIVAAGLANVQKILAVQIPNSSGSVAMPSISAGGTSIPTMPTQSNLTTLSGSNAPILTRELNMGKIKVYLPETDIRSATEKHDSLLKKVKVV